MVSIYVLLDHEDHPRYVGKAKDPAQRFDVHLSCDGAVKRWADSLPQPPRMEVIDEVEDHLWQHAERFWIAKFREMGCRLLNVQDGGQGASGPKSRAHREAIGESSRRNWQDPEYREKVLSGREGYRHSEETKRKISNRMRGRAHVGVPHTEETKLKLSQGRLGKPTQPHREDSKRLMAEKKKAHWADPVFRAKVAATKERTRHEREQRKLAEQAARAETGASSERSCSDSEATGGAIETGGPGGAGATVQEG